MARGLWRSWTTQGGVDVWSARVEIQPGEWADVDQAAYKAANHQPAFWDLPLKEDYVASVIPEPLPNRWERAELAIMPGVIVVLVIVGGLAFTVYVAWNFLSR
ncbi:MAG: hypothetical protein K2P70_13440 [Hyphomonadaceae bacterium]|nr:hypothetical protein [Hyphomonadaceae bacterium]